jgi:hypothetical protein
MPELLTALLAFPTVIFTGLMALILFYWLFVILGALDVDLFGGEEGVLDAAAAKGGALDAVAAKGGALDAVAAKGGALDAVAAKGGALDAVAAKGGALDAVAAKGGALDAVAAKGGAMDGLLDAADAEGALEGGEVDSESASWLLHAFNLRRAPVTVTGSLIVFFAWIASYLAMAFLAPIATVVLPEWLASTAILAGAIFLALPAASLATRPLEPIFKQRQGKTRQDFVGSVCRIQTGRVDERIGQATLEDGGAGLIIQVRGNGTLKRGQQALIIDYDRAKEAYIVEAYDAMLEAEAAEEEEAGRTARR